MLCSAEHIGVRCVSRNIRQETNMSNYKLTIAYDGTRYNGWQKQGNTDKTIQGKLEAVINYFAESVLGYKPEEVIEVNGAGRTDAGVHARGQVANVHVPKTGCESAMFKYLNEYLPEDICILGVEEVSERFHARLGARLKHYRYCICNNPKHPDIFMRKYEAYVREPLDINKMREAAAYFMGEHDFSSFCSNKHMKKSKVRNITDIKINKDTDRIVLDFYGNGFLYNMVRIITGTLIEVGMGERSPLEIPGLIEAKNRQVAGATAPAKGLYLMEVFYE